MRYRLSQDTYSNWYLLPQNEWKTWDTLINRPDMYNYDAYDRLEKYIIDIEKLTFENPNL